MNLCDYCKNKKIWATQAFTEYVCVKCQEKHTHDNGAVPKLCSKCSGDLNKCQRCLVEINFEFNVDSKQRPICEVCDSNITLTELRTGQRCLFCGWFVPDKILKVYGIEPKRGEEQ